MSSSTKRNRDLWRAIELLLAGVATGVVLGLAAGATVVQENGYLRLGLTRNALVTVYREALSSSIAAGVVVLFLLFGILLIRVGRKAFLESLNDKISRAGLPIPWRDKAWPYAACILVALLVIGLETLFSGRVGWIQTWGVIVLVPVWCGLYWFWRRSAPKSARVLALPLLAIPVLVILLSFSVGYPWSTWVARWQVSAALLIWTVVLVFLYLMRILLAASSARVVVGRLLLALVAIAPAMLWASSEFWSNDRFKVSNGKNVVLIVIDTLRRDHVKLGGEDKIDRGLSPNLRRLAERGTVFQNAISQAPWTMPAAASILTGRYPRDHGAISLTGSLGPRAVTMAEVLREAGYGTTGVVSHLYVDSEHGFSQGFDDFDDSNSVGGWPITSEAVTDDAIQVLNARTGRPFFLFVHYFDPHFEYRNHTSWYFADDYDGWLLKDRMDNRNLRVNRHLLDPQDIQYLKDLYDEEIAFTDQQIGRLIDQIEQLGLTSDTAIIVVADHGEEFMERGWLGHTITLYDELVRVPLIIALPERGAVNREVSRPVETRAIFDTVLDYLQVDNGLVSGSKSLLPSMFSRERQQETDAQPVYSEVWLPNAPLGSGKRVQMTSVRVGDWKLISDRRRDKEYLYNLRDDPLERNNLAPTDVDRLSRLMEPLELFLQQMSRMESVGADTQTVEEDLLERLRSLGYL